MGYFQNRSCLRGFDMPRYFPSYNTCYLRKIRCIQRVERYFRGTCYPKKLKWLKLRAELCVVEYQKRKPTDQIANAEALLEEVKGLLKAVETLETDWGKDANRPMLPPYPLAAVLRRRAEMERI